MSKSNDLNEQAWINPGSSFRSAPFWAWNSHLAPDRLTRQIQEMHNAGMGGFFMHSRYGLKTAYLSQEWFECVTACVEKARALDMKAYLYDEDRWPSGAAGGIVTRNHPELGLHKLIAVAGEKLPPAVERVANFAVKLNDKGQLLSYRTIEEGQASGEGESLIAWGAGVCEANAWFNEGAYLDTLSAAAVAEFIRVTHQAYADRYGQDFGTVIPAIFTDEPNYSHGHIKAEGLIADRPWTVSLPMEFKKRRGYDIRDHLPELIYPIAGQAFSKARHDYYRTITELFVENFSAQIYRWCEKHNIAQTGHYLAEETLYSQISVVGAAMPHYEYEQWPGIDILTDQIDQIGTAKQCSSVAAQLGRERVLSETYGCTGWDWPLEGHKFNAGWQFALGINFRCPHLSWYSMAGGAKRDYPASIFPHSPWWKHYKIVEDYFGRLSYMLTQGRPVRDVLVIHPVESAWGTFLAGDRASCDQFNKPFEMLMRLLVDKQYDFDLGDESLLAKHAKAAGSTLKVGKMEYTLVIVPPALTLRASTVNLLRRFIGGGGAVLFVGQTPEMIDAQPSDQLAELVEQAARCSDQPDAIAACVEGLLPRRVNLTPVGQPDTRNVPPVPGPGGQMPTPQPPYAWTMLRQVKGGRLLFVQSIDRKAGHELRISAQGHRPVVLWDALTGRRQRLEATVSGDRVEFNLPLEATGSAMISLGLRAGDAAPAAKPLAVSSAQPADGPWQAELTEPNVLPLDFCQFRIGEGEWSELVPVLTADRRIRANWGLPPRRNGGCQPWYLAQTGRFDRAVRGKAEVRFTFNAADVPSRLQVAVEGPENYQFVLNGKPVASTPVGTWLNDEDMKVVDLASAVKAGENELLLKFDYRSDMELEDLHLLGDFGIRQSGEARRPGAYTLVKPPQQLAPGSWVGQGLDFYGGSVNYRVAVPASAWSAISSGKRVRLSLPKVQCTAAAVHVGDKTVVIPWSPMQADLTDALLAQQGKADPAAAGHAGDPTAGRGGNPDCNYVTVEVMGGRHNSLGPLHVPWVAWTGPGEFDPEDKRWTNDYLLNDHGLMSAPVWEYLE